MMVTSKDQRNEKKMRAENLEKGWELMRLCTAYLRDNRDLKISRENRNLEKKNEEDRND